jgi:D-sedoheptulose 7-phosphate isomerase/D-glycero-D-manno-heptose 1,7-bisphosphate phosphatase
VRRRPGILLDRDGTIIVDKGYVGSIDRVELIEGSAEAIAMFNRCDIPVAVLSNQSGVARGYFGVDDVERVHSHLEQLLAQHDAHVDVYLFCPYHQDGVVEPFAKASKERKPGPGMALNAASLLGLDLDSSWVVGDRLEDLGLAEAIGASAVFLTNQTLEEIGDIRDRPNTWVTSDLRSAADVILERIVS